MDRPARLDRNVWRGIIGFARHRDVAPQNVIVGTDGVARITDFGLAKAEARATVTPVGQAAGRIVLGKNSVGTAQLKKNAVTSAISNLPHLRRLTRRALVLDPAILGLLDRTPEVVAFSKANHRLDA